MHAFPVFNFVARVNVAQIAELDTQIVTSNFERRVNDRAKTLGRQDVPLFI